MPVSTINLNCNEVSRKVEVDNIPSHLDFLLEDDAGFGERLPDLLLKKRLASRFSIAGEGAKLAIVIGGLAAKFLSACFALFDDGRAAALFAAKSRFPSFFFGAKCFSASFTLNKICSSRSALPTANGIAIGNAARNTKGFTANGANLFDRIKRTLTFSRAKEFVLLHGGGDIKGSLANRTNLVFPSAFSFGWFESKGFVINWHSTPTLSRIDILYHTLSTIGGINHA